MKHILTSILSLFLSLCCPAQEKASLENHPPRIIVQTGIGLQWFNETYRLYNLSVERPYMEYWHFGLDGTLYLQNPNNDFFASEFLDGYEIGGYAKYFLHGRLSGRRSGLFLGPGLRLGRRNFQTLQTDFFPPPIIPVYIQYKVSTTKILVYWGIQWQFGHANLEVSTPFGVEFYKSSFKVYGNYDDAYFVLLPTLKMGFGF